MFAFVSTREYIYIREYSAAIPAVAGRQVAINLARVACCTQRWIFGSSRVLMRADIDQVCIGSLEFQLWLWCKQLQEHASKKGYVCMYC
jgi:hypothetical protein